MNEIEERKEFEGLLGKALRPVYEPSEELNQKILAGEKKSEGNIYMNGLRKWYVLPKAAAIALAVVCVGSVGVYAAVKALKKPVVTDHAISVGNEDYIDDDAISRTEEPVTTNILATEAGNEDTAWIFKSVSEVNGYTTTSYTYDSYTAALKDAGMGIKFTKEYELSSDGAYFSTTEGDGYSTKCISATFIYNEGCFSVNQDISSGNIAEDAAYSIKLQNTSNEREYSSTSGTEYYLVDEIAAENNEDVVTTYVMLSTDNTNGYISFKGLSEDEMHEVLDTVLVE